MPDEEIEPVAEETIEYTCVRCGYKYNKKHDYEPYLCHRCMRFIAKKVWTLIHTLVPPVSRPAETADI